MSRLSTRLLISHALVAVIGGLTVYLLVRVLAPEMYDQHVQMMGGAGTGHDTGLRDAAISATNNALLIGVLAGIVTAMVAGAYSSVRILRPLQAVSAATHRMAEGRYDQRVALPREPELAAVAQDVNSLGERLAATESRRMRLLGEVAHEMRTPLTVLDGYIEGLIDAVFEPGPEILAELGSEVRRLRRLADDLRELSRAEEGSIDLNLEVVDLAGVGARAAERLRPQFEDAGIELAVQGSDPLRVRGDSYQLAQVVTNVLGNALAATPRGGTVELRAARDGGDILLTVTDSGVGLDPEDLTRIFERFYRIPTPGEKHSRAGSGIGLTIARGIARAHGGELAAQSSGPALGSIFALRLPATQPGRAPSRP